MPETRPDEPEKFVKPLDGFQASVSVRPDGGIEFRGWHTSGYDGDMQKNMCAILDWLKDQVMRGRAPSLEGIYIETDAPNAGIQR